MARTPSVIGRVRRKNRWKKRRTSRSFMLRGLSVIPFALPPAPSLRAIMRGAGLELRWASGAPATRPGLNFASRDFIALQRPSSASPSIAGAFLSGAHEFHDRSSIRRASGSAAALSPARFHRQAGDGLYQLEARARGP